MLERTKPKAFHLRPPGRILKRDKGYSQRGKSRLGAKQRLNVPKIGWKGPLLNFFVRHGECKTVFVAY